MRTLKKSQTLVSPREEESKAELLTNNKTARNLNFGKSEVPEGMKSPQNLSGVESRDDLQNLLPEILVKNQLTEDLYGLTFSKEFRG